MQKSTEQLAPAEDPFGRPFASMSHYPGDIALLNYLLQDLRSLVRRHRRAEFEIAPHDLFTWDVHGLDRRIVMCDPAVIQESEDVLIVGFFGDRRDSPDDALIDASEFDLISEFANYPGILSYSSIELVDDYWANLVVHRQPSDREAWRGSDVHKHAVHTVAPHAYHGVRIHNGRIPGGVPGSGTIVLESTKYWDYDSGDSWHGMRTVTASTWRAVASS